jgi:hypothetical protein
MRLSKIKGTFPLFGVQGVGTFLLESTLFTSVSPHLMVRFCENTYRFVGILRVLKQGVALGTKGVHAPMW